ncbi:S41A family C-terminal processing peptidase-3 [Pontibacter ummariensis]|uniref:C-terminal processing peptidase-3. Serine peptidase. MEROPS family S41A n=2 Tax=Pontibacter ummariensis TaxID=1610492 RepID=A0A239H1F0_9BACT|nr:S41A family C-terminal processing peptidase-3 [Pontibacter ummariensis]SNS74633.1 C-terminal processing peptidase-3. Serine peptidase. MEROPS family S41A [Pontibacter ummariensis]
MEHGEERKGIRNSPFQIKLPLFIAVALVVGVLIGATTFSPSTTNPQGTAKSYLKFRDILSYIDRDYVDTVDIEELSDYAITKMLEKLDPHTAYIPADELAMAWSYLEGDFEGIGVEFNIFNDTIYVISPLSGGPSEAAGIQAGDKIIKVDGETVAGIGITNEGVFKRLRGPKGSEVNLTVLRDKTKAPMNFTIVRNKIPTNSVDVSYMVDANTGYIKVSRFSANTFEEFKQALTELRRKGMQQLILDLRGNPGGYMDHAIRMADEFISGKKLIVYTDGKGDKYDSKTLASTKGEFEEGALVVLVDEGSASASEIVAGALQDNDRALIVGRRSFGKGLVQMPIPLNDGSELRLTISRYYTPSGRSIQKPYTEGAEEYQMDFMHRLENGELFHPDSSLFVDSLRYETLGGRAVYGGGGIMPDVFVAQDTTELSDYLSQLYNKNVIREYTLNYYSNHRKELEAMPFEKFNKNFRVTDAMLQEVVQLARSAGVDYNDAEFRRSKNLLRNNVKAFIARSVYGNEGFYPVLHESDDEFQQALRQLSRAQRLSKGGA